MNTKPISVEELARRFKRGNRWATARMREMRHSCVGGQLFTTEEWLAEWLAAESVPQTNWPKQNLDPLEEAVCSRVIESGQCRTELAAHFTHPFQQKW